MSWKRFHLSVVLAGILSISTLTASSVLAKERTSQVHVVLLFDTEDFLLPASDDATRRLAEMLTKRGIRATFRVVGELARTLEKRGRTDVIAALNKHDIGYHSNLHSIHPTPAEYLAECGLLDGVAEFVRHEKPGTEDVRRVFGRKTLSCYCQPGASWACQELIALEQIDVAPVAAEIGFFTGLQDRPFWFAGTLNVYEVGDNYTDVALYDPGALEPAKAKVSQMVRRLRSDGGGVITIGYHPCDWVHRAFWDAINFRYGANPPRDQWKVPPQRTPEETEQAFKQFAAYIDHIQSLGVRFTAADQLPANYPDRVRTEGLSEAELLQLTDKVLELPAVGIDYQVAGGKTVSAADLFEILTFAWGDVINGKEPLFPRIARGLIGPDSAPGDAAHSGLTISSSAFREAILDVRDYLKTNRRVPARVFIGADFVSPADFLGGMASAWHLDAGQHRPPAEVKLGVNLAVLPERHLVRIPTTPFTWSIHKPDLHLTRILEVARLQTWTLKPAVLTSRDQ